MSFSQNALNSEKIKTQQDIIDVRNSYKAQLQSQININNTKRNVNALYELNGSLPHYTPTLRTTQEILADKNELKKNTIEYIQDALLADAQNAISIVDFVSINFSLVQFRQELPTIVREYLELFSMGITLDIFKESFTKLFPHYGFSNPDNDKDVYDSGNYDDNDDNDDDKDDDNIKMDIVSDVDDDDDDDDNDDKKKKKKNRIKFDKGSMKAKSRRPKQNKSTKPKQPVFTSTPMPSIPLSTRQNTLETEKNNREKRKTHDETVYPDEKRNKRDRKRTRDDDSSKPDAKRRRLTGTTVRLDGKVKNEAKGNAFDSEAVNEVKQPKRNMTQAQEKSSRYVKRRQTPIDDMTVPQLKAFAESANIVIPPQVKKGNKATLFAYLSNYENNNTPLPDNEVVRSYGRHTSLMNDFGEMKTINEMKSYAQSKGIQIPTNIRRKIEIYNYLNEVGRQPAMPQIASLPAPVPRPSVRKIKGKMSGSGIYTRETQESRWYGSNPQNQYKPLGSKLIHHNRLCYEHIVSLNHKCGAIDKNFPVRKVSSTFANILRDVVNSKAPNFEELYSLSDDDKAYLHHILKTTRANGYYSVPMPSKLDDDKDFERFEWCLGQIKAGNNNSDVVKELKLKLMKYRNEKRLPRGQINQILYQLNDLGY